MGWWAGVLVMFFPPALGLEPVSFLASSTNSKWQLNSSISLLNDNFLLACWITRVAAKQGEKAAVLCVWQLRPSPPLRISVEGSGVNSIN